MPGDGWQLSQCLADDVMWSAAVLAPALPGRSNIASSSPPPADRCQRTHLTDETRSTPTDAVVITVDERSQLQALNRPPETLPLRPRQARAHPHIRTVRFTPTKLFVAEHGRRSYHPPASRHGTCTDITDPQTSIRTYIDSYSERAKPLSWAKITVELFDEMKRK